MNRTYAPVALVIDDDPAVINRMKTGFIEDTSMGVLVANNLKDANSFLRDKSVKIDALITDLNFTPGTQAGHLVSGIDILEISKKFRPDIPQYVLSVDAEEERIKNECDEKRLRVEEFFPKLGSTQPRKPWETVERACLAKTVKTNQMVRENMEANGIDTRNLVDEVEIFEAMRRLPMARLTYLLEVPGFRVKKPIEVLCVKDGDLYRASAIQIGLITDGEGADTADAIEALAKLIAEEADFDATQKGTAAGYAAHVQKMLRQFIEPV